MGIIQTQAKQGGKREGAGRKPNGNTAKTRISFRLSEDVIKIIKNQPNQAEFLENIVRKSQSLDIQ